MLKNYYRSEKYVEHLLRSPVGSYLDEFAKSLWEVGYTELSARRFIRGARDLVKWAQDNLIPLEKINDAEFDRFQQQLPDCRRLSFTGGQHALLRGAFLFVEHLQRINVIPPPAEENQKTETSPLLDAFCKWLRESRNLSEATIENYSFPVRDFLKVMGEDASCFDAQGLRRFILNRNSSCGRGKVKITVTALRTFTRFLISQGLCAVGLDATIPTVAHWQLSSLPRYLQPEEVERVIAACNPDMAAGVRDRAIMLLLARLALRADDIVNMRLSDIDWKEGWIRVSGKGRRETRLPLLQEVGEAIFEYITKSRPPMDTDILFLRSHAPLRQFGSHDAVTRIVADAMRRAGIDRSVRGAAHVFRHSAATTMLREGASIEDIAVVLRHQFIKTTSIYAKVDVLALRDIAQPWPGEVDPC
jgi:site-specific recombinase XerD